MWEMLGVADMWHVATYGVFHGFSRFELVALSSKVAQARDPQERGEIQHIAPVAQDLVVELHDQGVGGNPLFGRQARQRVPDEVFHPDAGRHPPDAHGAGTRFVKNRIGGNEEFTHGESPA